MDAPLVDTLATVPGSDRNANALSPGFAPLTPPQITALVQAARQSVALARAQIGARGPSKAVALWRRLVATSRPAPASIEGDVATIVSSALKPLHDVCVNLPLESGRLIGVLVSQVILVEALDLAGVRQRPAERP
jgi:hypothetical protein